MRHNRGWVMCTLEVGLIHFKNWTRHHSRISNTTALHFSQDEDRWGFFSSLIFHDAVEDWKSENWYTAHVLDRNICFLMKITGEINIDRAYYTYSSNFLSQTSSLKPSYENLYDVLTCSFLNIYWLMHFVLKHYIRNTIQVS